MSRPRSSFGIRSRPNLRSSQTGRFGSPNAFADLLQVFSMQRDQIAECFGVARGSRDGGFAAVDAPLDLKRPFLGVFPAQECLVTYFPFPRTWAPQEREFSLVNVAKRVRSVCTEPSNCRTKGRMLA
jgi:hypothetical protein